MTILDGVFMPGKMAKINMSHLGKKYKHFFLWTLSYIFTNSASIDVLALSYAICSRSQTLILNQILLEFVNMYCFRFEQVLVYYSSVCSSLDVSTFCLAGICLEISCPAWIQTCSEDFHHFKSCKFPISGYSFLFLQLTLLLIRPFPVLAFW